MSSVPEDRISCESCGCNIVYGDECDNGIEILCADCYAIDYAADQKANEMTRLQMAQSTQGVTPW